nr:YMGG-like glycine zipper-containing protein [Photobacterium sp. BZF1]
MPAKVKVDNTKGQKNASKAGALIGAIAGGFIGDNSGEAGVGAAIGGIAGGVTGSMVDKEILIDGVSLTYAHDGKTLNAIQVAKACQFKPGIAVMVSTDSGDARLQPNTTCPVEK